MNLRGNYIKTSKNQGFPATKFGTDISSYVLSVLQEIVDKKDQGSFNYKTLMEKIQVSFNLLELFQTSPDATKQINKV
ncbi:predicted protein [Sclerotinia sclerotiorum 1980 UF-70]|uniref:Uncharacterized protein n=1 Tax=Sclerotinia sclerotiorum (strain ATCC 18683 / 1980 / Ss-1) TaxID=665079 RepID=A7F4J4_SCLS1|nr:predicted protein [Sclerotinia sclerotiorum 1980 UF-70]EDN97665.1 predicted protein [Sclerotinia sclerotiorum 1980 UF-70]